MSKQAGKGDTVEAKQNGSFPPKWMDGCVYVSILVLVVTPLLLLSLPPLIYLAGGGEITEADMSSADRVLSFLEGASVLIGGAVAVAAIYGFRNAQEVRKELRETLNHEAEKLENVRAELRAKLREGDERLIRLGERLREEMEATRKELREEQERLNSSGEALREREERLAQELQEAHDVVATLQMNTAELSEAYHNILHRNYQQAFDLAQSILQRDPENITALYLSGWLSIQFLKNRTVDQAISDLEKALQLAQAQGTEARSLAIKAALGVAYRRKGKQQKEVRERYFAKAENYLLEVTGNEKTERLLDLYAESFYAPLGGLYRDRGQLDKAIECYRKATEITPGSSYPWGNLAQLLWETGEPEEDVMRAFRRTYRTAEREQGATPEDYYLLMDLAMSSTVLGKFKEAEEWLEEALAASLTEEMLRTSLNGWQFLLKSCPQGEKWDAVRQHLKAGLDAVTEAIEKRQS